MVFRSFLMMWCSVKHRDYSTYVAQRMSCLNNIVRLLYLTTPEREDRSESSQCVLGLVVIMSLHCRSFQGSSY